MNNLKNRLIKIYLLPILLLLSACAEAPKDPRTKSTIDQELLEYVQFYEETYNTTVSSIPINFKELDGEWIGVCYTWNGGWAEIFIDPVYWETATEEGRMAVMFHELGHCHRLQDHRNNLLSDGCPASIMNEYQPWQHCLVKHWNYYVEEMR